MHVRMHVYRASTLLAVGLCALSGCYATSSAPGSGVAALRQGALRGEVVLRPGPLGVHVGPHSWLRFTLRDGARSPWFAADKLRVSAAMIVATGGRARATDAGPFAEGVPWDEIASVEVNELDVGETVVGVTAGAAVIVTAATAEVLLLTAFAAATNGHVSGDLGLTRGAVDVVLAEALKRPEEDSAARTIGIAATDATDAEQLATRPLFTASARRRADVLFTVTSDVGFDAGVTPSPVAGLAAGLRLDNFFDVQLGGRSALAPATEQRPAQLRSVPFLRLGLHLDLDAGRRVALAAGADVGLTSDQLSVRFLYGVRVRLTERMQLGVYPWNPVGIASGAPAPGAPGPGRLNLLELTWLL